MSGLSEQQALTKSRELAGWNDASVIFLLMEYIENQASPGAFQDFLEGQVEREAECAGARDSLKDYVRPPLDLSKTVDRTYALLNDKAKPEEGFILVDVSKVVPRGGRQVVKATRRTDGGPVQLAPGDLTPLEDLEFHEHNKLKAVSDQSQAQGAFLDWLQSSEQGMQLHEWRVFDGGDSDYYPCTRSIESLLAEYHEIDRDRLELEKQVMLVLQRRLNGINQESPE